MKRNTDLSLQTKSQTGFGPHTNSADDPGKKPFEFDGTEQYVLEKQLAMIRTMAQLSSSGVTVYDMQNDIHIFTSKQFYKIYGYEIGELQTNINNEVYDSKIHPDDLEELKKNGYEAMQFIMNVPAEARKQYKMVSEYRILNGHKKYMHVIEQQQILEQDALGNIWLSLGVIDISPNQTDMQGVKYQINNFHTGELIHLAEPTEKGSLTDRELEVLKMISAGKLSKEIGGLLEISVHTVNTHRQRILEKLRADNSIEAVNMAKRNGLI
ncbi:LuxR C-terminal-related transcriptional regulator [Dyadobacter sp. CY107]|uniref:LuxR C-terminal-related transcriptional regulator n=1 Tax=Dyadobacter fanqingshengii TaxID=2906443 RepID=UPI001F1CEE92|nr:LuxR C-terminal-related transcriptional regulator [Dyadobacter fanqingshengii]MCF2502669.1 LuxR C-terminal-related transcriptional regulator [Dyadobacter fanqingshengii]